MNLGLAPRSSGVGSMVSQLTFSGSVVAHLPHQGRLLCWYGAAARLLCFSLKKWDADAPFQQSMHFHHMPVPDIFATIHGYPRQ